MESKGTSPFTIYDTTGNTKETKYNISGFGDYLESTTFPIYKIVHSSGCLREIKKTQKFPLYETIDAKFYGVKAQLKSFF